LTSGLVCLCHCYVLVGSTCVVFLAYLAAHSFRYGLFIQTAGHGLFL